MTTLKQLEKVVKEVLLSKPTSKTKYENKMPSKVDLNKKFKVVRKP